MLDLYFTTEPFKEKKKSLNVQAITCSHEIKIVRDGVRTPQFSVVHRALGKSEGSLGAGLMRGEAGTRHYP